ncbi:MAG: hypothetical protein JXA67_13530 [Micromonosporaceae bacterium]|nr:hypothetical protein [Micromonosporaceae bacterium]
MGTAGGLFDDGQFDDAQLWEPTVDAVPPVIGRMDRATRQPIMEYVTSGEITDPDGASSDDNWFETDDGVDVGITF